jgi:short-subunit dehydrogenase
MQTYAFAGGTAVTGAASGIGAALAHALARRGSHLVLLDRDTERLSGVAAAIRGGNPALRVETHVVDLADGDATTRVANTVLAEPGSHLANVSSILGLIAPAGQVAYTASKFAVRGFTRAASAPGSPSRRASAAACHARRRKAVANSSPPC